MRACFLCNGSGLVSNKTCPACGGIGKEAQDDMRCQMCEGSGLYLGEQCPACHGDRVINRPRPLHIDTEYLTCATCSGTGRRNDKVCWSCGGVGKILYPKDPDYFKKLWKNDSI